MCILLLICCNDYCSASLHLHNYEESLACAKRLKELDPQNTSVEPLLLRIHKRIAEYKAREKQMSASMASKLFKTKRQTVNHTDELPSNRSVSTTESTPSTSKPSVTSHQDESNVTEENAPKNLGKIPCEMNEEIKPLTGTVTAGNSSKKDSTPTWMYLVAIAVLLAINTLLVLALIYY